MSYTVKYSEVNDRLKKVLNAKSDDDLAKGLEITPQAFFSFKKQNNIPSELLVRFCLVHQISIDWLIRGDQEKNSEYVQIPMYCPGAFTGETENENKQAADTIAFNSEWLKSEFKANKLNLYLLLVYDDTMEPTLKNGDIAIVNRRETSLFRDGIYLLRIKGASIVKRVQRLPDGFLLMSSDNHAYQSIKVKQEELNKGEIFVVGRIVWSGKKY